eukprot:6208055-Pleurochrysis_carterae.AAC.1
MLHGAVEGKQSSTCCTAAGGRAAAEVAVSAQQQREPRLTNKRGQSSLRRDRPANVPLDEGEGQHDHVEGEKQRKAEHQLRAQHAKQRFSRQPQDTL